jgi:hypothetical protein
MDTGSVAGPLRVDAVEKSLAIIGAPNPHSAFAMSAFGGKADIAFEDQNVRF